MTQLISFLIGSCLGSHALVVVQRFDKSNFIWGSSKCDICQTPLSLLDEIPIYSYLKNKGRCKFCQTEIPIITLIAELLGGFAFINMLNNFDALKIIFIFYFLIITLQDYEQQEFSTIFLVPLLAIAIFSSTSQYHYFKISEWLSFLIFFLVFLIQILAKKMGSGDLLVFIMLALYLGIESTIRILLFACILFIIYYFFNRKKSALPFLPFIFSGLIINNFL